jgi:hypothetical protein
LLSTKETNIGLTAVFGIVKQNGGTLEVDSRPGQGTVVQIVFPAAPSPETWKEVMPKVMLAKGDETILLVVENEIERKLALSALPVSLSSLGGGIIGRGAYAHPAVQWNCSSHRESLGNARNRGM